MFVSVFFFTGLVLCGVLHIIEKRKTNRFFLIINNKETRKIENVSASEIVRYGGNTRHNISCSFTIFISDNFFAFVRHSDFFLKKMHTPTIITNDLQKVQDLNFLPCFKIISKEVDKNNYLKLTLRNYKSYNHSKEVTLARLSKIDIEILTAT